MAVDNLPEPKVRYTPGGTSESDAAAELDKLIPDDVGTELLVEPQKDDEADTTDESDELDASADTDTQAEDESGSDDLSEDEDEPAPTSKTRKLKVQDEEIPEDEVVKGYMKGKDYTQKTQKLAARERELEQRMAVVNAESSEYATTLADLRENLVKIQGQEPDWTELQKGDAAIFAKTYATWHLGQENLRKIEAEQVEVRRRQDRDNAEATRARVKIEAEKLRELIPTWKADPAVEAAEKVELVKYALEEGWTIADLEAVTDHRTLKLLRNAWIGSKAATVKATAKTKIDAVKIVTPGTPAAPKTTKKAKVQEAAKRVDKSGRVDDAVAWLNAAIS